MSNFKILFISSEFPPGPGGIGNQGYNIVKNLNSSGYKTNVITISDFANEKEVDLFDSSVPFKIIRFQRYNYKIITALNRFRKLLRVIKSDNYNLIICSGRFSLWLGYLIRKSCKIPSIAIAHGGDINSSNKVIKYITDRALGSFNTVIAVSGYTCKKLPPKIKKNKYVVIPNGVDLNEFESVRVNKKAQRGSPSLLTIGNVWRRKGQQNVISHLPLLLKKYPRLHYHCVGHTTEVEFMKRLISELKVEDNVTFHGKVSREKLYQFYSSSDIFVMLSEEQESGDFEGFGIAILEANIFGLPAIGSLNSGIQDAIEHKSSGILIDPKSSAEFSWAVDDILNNKHLYSSNAIKFAQRHSWEFLIKKYIKEIEEICAAF